MGRFLAPKYFWKASIFHPEFCFLLLFLMGLAFGNFGCHKSLIFDKQLFELPNLQWYKSIVEPPYNYLSESYHLFLDNLHQLFPAFCVSNFDFLNNCLSEYHMFCYWLMVSFDKEWPTSIGQNLAASFFFNNTATLGQIC
jgi:hypothetical protein